MIDLLASEASQYLFMKIEILGICMRQISVNQYVRRVHKNEQNTHAQYKISLLSNFISFASLVYVSFVPRPFCSADAGKGPGINCMLMRLIMNYCVKLHTYSE